MLALGFAAELLLARVDLLLRFLERLLRLLALPFQLVHKRLLPRLILLLFPGERFLVRQTRPMLLKQYLRLLALLR